MILDSQDIKQQKLNELKNIFPEIFEDKTINYDKLKDIPPEAKLVCYEKSLDDSVKLNLYSNVDLETL